MAGNFLSYANYSLDSMSYSVVISSADKISGTNNNGFYNVSWDSLLPRQYQKYKVAFTFQTTAGTYKDQTYSTYIAFSSATVRVNWGGRSYSYDTNTKGASINLGVIAIDPQSTTTVSNTLGCYYLYNPPRTISRPNQDLVNISIYNQYNNALLVDTNASGAATLLSDMTAWTGYFEFVPIRDDDIVKSQGRDSL